MKTPTFNIRIFVIGVIARSEATKQSFSRLLRSCLPAGKVARNDTGAVNAKLLNMPVFILREFWMGLKSLSPLQRFYLAIGISLTIHLCWVFIFSSAHRIPFLKRPVRHIEVTYETTKVKDDPKAQVQEQKVNMTRQRQVAKSVKIFAKESDTISSFKGKVSEVSKFSRRLELDEKEIPKMGTMRTVSIPMFKAEKITNPRYLNYNEKIREKIRLRAYSFVENLEFQSGEVYLTFVLLSTGELSQIKIIEEKTKADRQLRDIGVRSIQESNPYPPFPPDLHYPELTFNVVISFEVSQ